MQCHTESHCKGDKCGQSKEGSEESEIKTQQEKIPNSTHLSWIRSSLMASTDVYILISPALPPEAHMTSFLDATLSPFSYPWKTFIFLTFPVSWDCYCDLQISISVSCFIKNVQGNSLLHLARPQLSSTLMFPKLLPTFMSITTPSSTDSSRYTMDHWTAGPQVIEFLCAILPEPEKSLLQPVQL